jgi:hypothetical protein
MQCGGVALLAGHFTRHLPQSALFPVTFWRGVVTLCSCSLVGQQPNTHFKTSLIANTNFKRLENTVSTEKTTTTTTSNNNNSNNNSKTFYTANILKDSCAILTHSGWFKTAWGYWQSRAR